MMELINKRNTAIKKLEYYKQMLKLNNNNAHKGLKYIRKIINIENYINYLTAEIEFIKAN